MTTVCFGGENQASAQRYFRATLPSQALAARSSRWQTSVAHLVVNPESPVEIANDPRLRGGEKDTDHFGNLLGVHVMEPADIMTLRLMDDFDVLDPMRPPNETAMAKSIERARDAGQIVLYDLDDDVWTIPEWSPAFKAMSHESGGRWRAIQIPVLENNLRASDGLICSTPRIAEVAEARVPGLKTWVVRNGIDVRMWKWPRKPLEHTPLRVGWMGSVSHHAPHLRTMMEALDVLTKHNAEFVFLGWTEGWAREAAELLDELPCKTDWRPWVDFRQLPDLLADVDVGIIPRVETPFNEGQSTTSGMEYAAAGCPFIAFPSDEYRRAEDQGYGITARSVKDWRNALELLLGNKAVRTASREIGRKALREYCGPDTIGEDYERVFSEVMERRGVLV